MGEKTRRGQQKRRAKVEKCEPPLIISNAVFNALLLVVAFLMQLAIAGYFTWTYIFELSTDSNSLFVGFTELKVAGLISVEFVALLFLVAVPVASALMGIRRVGDQSGEFMALYLVLTLVSMVVLVLLAGISFVAAGYFVYTVLPLDSDIQVKDIFVQQRFLRILLFSVNAVLYVVQPVFRFVTVIASTVLHMTIKINRAWAKHKEYQLRKKMSSDGSSEERHRHRHHHRRRGNAIISSEQGDRHHPAVMALQHSEERRNSSTSQTSLQPTLQIDTSKYMLRLDDFRLIEKIGSGGFGSVFKAEYDDNIVALKILNFDAEKEAPEEVAMFIREFQNEAQLLCQLRHPNILYFLGVCMGPKYAIATEFLDIGSLADILHKPELRKEKHIPLTWPLKLKIMIDVSRGVKYLHSMHMIHRDLKPHNILLDKNFVAKVADFGLAKSTNKHLRGISGYIPYDEPVHENMTTFVGSPLWMSPEVILSYNYDYKADVFSFGISMWEVLFEQPPYDNIPLHVMQIAQRVATEGLRPTLFPIPDPDDTHIQSRDLYIRLMQYCWMHDPRHRPSFEDIIKELKDIFAKAEAEAVACLNNVNSLQSMVISPIIASPINVQPDPYV